MKVTIYTIPDCPFSKQAKDFMNSKSIQFVEKNVQEDRAALAEMLEASDNFAGVPFILVTKDSGEVVKLKGFTQSEFEIALGLGTSESSVGAQDSASVAPASTEMSDAQPAATSTATPAATPPVDPVATPPMNTMNPSVSPMSSTTMPAPTSMDSAAAPTPAAPVAPLGGPVSDANVQSELDGIISQLDQQAPASAPAPMGGGMSGVSDDPMVNMNNNNSSMQPGTSGATSADAASPTSQTPAMPSVPDMGTTATGDAAQQSTAPVAAPDLPDFPTNG